MLKDCYTAPIMRRTFIGAWFEIPNIHPKIYKKYPLDKEDPTYGKIYRSPIPFHAPEVPNSFRAHMVRVIVENGWGQFQYYPRTKDPETGKYMRRYLIIEHRMP